MPRGAYRPRDYAREWTNRASGHLNGTDDLDPFKEFASFHGRRLLYESSMQKKRKKIQVYKNRQEKSLILNVY